MKQDKQMPSCSMDIRNCMAIASQKIKLTQDVSSTDNRDDQDVIDLVSENEEAIEIEDDMLAYADKELYDDISKLHSLAQSKSNNVKIIDSHVLEQLSCLETECPKFLTTFDFPDLGDDDITLEKIQNINIENMFKSSKDHAIVFEEYKINTDELVSKFEVNSANNNFVPSDSNGYENIKNSVICDNVSSTKQINMKDDINLVSKVCAVPKMECKKVSENGKISANNSSITDEQTVSQLPSIYQTKQENNLKLIENVSDADDSFSLVIKKENLTEIETVKEESKRYFEENGQIINMENTISPSEEKSGDSKIINEECNLNDKNLSIQSLICGTRKFEKDDSYNKSRHFSGKQIYTKKCQISPVLTSGKKTCEYDNEHPVSPVLSNRLPIQPNGNDNDNKESSFPILSNRISTNLKSFNSLPKNQIQSNELENDDEYSKLPILSGTTQHIKIQTSLKKNLFINQNESRSHFESTPCKVNNKLSTTNSLFVFNKSMTKHVKIQDEPANNSSSEMKRNTRPGNFLNIPSGLFKSSKTENTPLSNLTVACSPEIVGIDDLFEDIDKSDSKSKNVSTEKRSTKIGLNNTLQKSISHNVESENEFIFNFDDLFGDDIDSNFSLPAAATARQNKSVQQDNKVKTNQTNKLEKQSCTSPIVISKHINSQSTPQSRLSGFVNSLKASSHRKRKLPIIESSSETESDTLDSPILKLMQGTENALLRCSTPVRNLSIPFSCQKPPEQSSKLELLCKSFGKGNITANSKQIEQVDYFQLDGEDDNWSFSQLFDENKTKEEDESMYTISQLVAKSSGLPTPKPSKQQEELVPDDCSEVSSKLKEENLYPSKTEENHLGYCKTSDSGVSKAVSNFENKSANPVVNRHSNIFKFDSDDDLFEGIDSNVLNTTGITYMHSTVNRENVSKITSAKNFEKDSINERDSHKKMAESRYNSLNGYVKNKGLSESPSISQKENIYGGEKNIYLRKNLCFSNSKGNKTLSVLNGNKMNATCNSNKLDNSFQHNIPLKNHVIVENYDNVCEKKPVLSSGWITTKNVSKMKRTRPDDFTTDDSDTDSVFVCLRRNGMSKQVPRNVKKKIKKWTGDVSSMYLRILKLYRVGCNYKIINSK